MTESQLFIALIYGLIGLTGLASLIVFIWGFITYIMRLGTVRRDEGIKIMQHSIPIIISSIVLIGIVNLLHRWLGV